MSTIQDQLLKEAKLAVQRAEQQSMQAVQEGDIKSGKSKQSYAKPYGKPRGFRDPNVIDGILAGMMPDTNIQGQEDVRRLRIGELARAWAKMSDGQDGEIDNKKARTAFNNVVNGMNPDGKGYAESQKQAMRLGLPQFLTDHVREKTRKHGQSGGRTGVDFDV